MTALGHTLETPRLILRPPLPEDCEAFAAMAQEEATMRYFGGLAPPAVAWRRLATVAGSWSLLGYGMFSVIEKETGQWIGQLGPWYPGGETGGWPGREVGWGLIAAAQGKGYAAEGAAAAIDYVFDALGWDEVIHCIDKPNAPSIRLAERLGSRLQSENILLPPPYGTPVDIYAQSREQWRSRK
jgi:RimJ/RimL family protein N-acetyltransferase